jgi:DNA repair protein RadC
MSLFYWPKQERPREKLLAHGAEFLSNAELLAILFAHGTAKKSALELARDLLTRFHSLRGLFSADFASLKAEYGIGTAKYCLIKAAHELGRRILQENLQEKTAIKSFHDIHLFLQATLRDLSQEVFVCVFLDSALRVIQVEKLFFGTINQATIHPREVLKRALAHNAAAIIVAHNHPSGIPKPSQADKEITQLLKDALALVDIRLLDHIIIGDNEWISLEDILI